MNTSDKIAFIALGTSMVTFLFSWYSFYKTDRLSKSAFNRNYRPYVLAGNFAYIDQKDGKYYAQMNVLMIHVLNAPAFVTSKKLTFYTRTNNMDILLFEHPDCRDELLYPLDDTQHTIGTNTNTISHEIAQQLFPNILIRKARIEYQWISDSTLTYYFEAKWKYNLEKQDWDIVYQKAN